MLGLNQLEGAELGMTAGLRTHPSAVKLWLLQLEMVGEASGSGEMREKVREEVGEVCKKALTQVPVQVSLSLTLLV